MINFWCSVQFEDLSAGCVDARNTFTSIVAAWDQHGHVQSLSGSCVCQFKWICNRPMAAAGVVGYHPSITIAPVEPNNPIRTLLFFGFDDGGASLATRDQFMVGPVLRR